MSRCPRGPSSRKRSVPRARGAASRVRRLGLAGVLGVLIAGAAGRAEAEEGARGPITTPVELRQDRTVDLAVTAALAGSYATALLVRDDLQPSGCRWCDGSRPSDLNVVDDWFRTALRRPDPQPANLASHVIAFGVGPLAAGGLTALASVTDRRESGALTDLTVVAQGVLSASLATEVLKAVFARPRPYAHAAVDEDARREALLLPESSRSFPSGHTSAVFAMAAASGTVATMRGYRLAPLVWAVGLMLGVTTAYARVAADKHYFTDTVGGAAVGLAFGAGLPLLFHRPVSKRPVDGARLGSAQIGVTPIPGGRIVSVGWTFE